MNLHSRYPLGLSLLAVSLVAAIAIPAEPPPVFLAKWGSSGTLGGEFDSPSGVAVDSTGNVYVVDKMNHRIQKFDDDGSFVTEWGSYGTGSRC